MASHTKPNEPTLVHLGALSAQVCIPADWTNGQAQAFCKQALAELGWPDTDIQMRQDGHILLARDPERNPCAEHDGFVHITFDL